MEEGGDNVLTSMLSLRPSPYLEPTHPTSNNSQNENTNFIEFFEQVDFFVSVVSPPPPPFCLMK